MKYNFEQKRNDYETPPELVKLGLKIANREKEFDMDVCCSHYNIPAKLHLLDGEYDGLKEEWSNLNWCNPPYDECDKWVKKAYEEQQKGGATVMLIPVRTETKYWHDYILFNPDVEIHWLRKGYGFINPETNNSMGVFKNALALVYFKKVLNE